MCQLGAGIAAHGRIGEGGKDCNSLWSQRERASVYIPDTVGAVAVKRLAFGTLEENDLSEYANETRPGER